MLVVLGFHYFPGYIRSGYLGVDIFFVISGFVITRSFFMRDEISVNDIKYFLDRRARRLLPAIIFLLVMTMFVAYFLLFSEEFRNLSRYSLASMVFITNGLAYRDIDYFSKDVSTLPLIHFWSLGVEGQFYIFLPLLLVASTFLKRKISINGLLVICFCISFSLWIFFQQINTSLAFYSPISRFWEILVGSLLARRNKEKLESQNNYRIKKFCSSFLVQQLVRDYIFIIGILLCTFKSLKVLEIDLSILFIVAITAYLMHSMDTIGRVAKLLNHQISRYLGKMSFSIYLFHWPIISFFSIVKSESLTIIDLLICIMLTIALSFISYFLVEMPFREGRKHPLLSLKFISLISSIVFIVSLVVFRLEGIPQRSHITSFEFNLMQLSRTQPIDKECIQFIGIVSLEINYCRANNGGHGKWVALIGDSHAHTAYPGISEILDAKGYNTILIANSGCPPYLAISKKLLCNERTQQQLEIIENRQSIVGVILISRAALYISGSEPKSGSKKVFLSTVSKEEFNDAVLQGVTHLSRIGKKPMLLTPTPELQADASKCVIRPLRVRVNICSLKKSEFQQRPGISTEELINAKIPVIHTEKFFCDKIRCRVFDEDMFLLYSDDHHLSIAGSKFLAQNVFSSDLALN